jgi:periplasmic divalent cation tolerance protein
MKLITVFTTVSSQADADALAQNAVANGLAACVQTEAIQSTYRWKDNIVQAPEFRLTFKTTADGYKALEQWLLQAHPYELPALYAMPVLEASPAYADWVQHSVSAVSDKK